MGLSLLNRILLWIALPEDWSPLWISLKTACIATGLTFCLGLLAARWMIGQDFGQYGLGRHGRRRDLVDGLFTLPLVLPPTVVGFFLLLLLGQNSPIGQLLALLNISVVFTWGAVVVAAVVVSFPLMYKTSLAALEQVDSTLAIAARTLGASEWQIFWQILLPMAWPGVLAGMVLAFARSLGEFGATLMVGGSIPGVTQTMPIALFFAAESGRLDIALAWVLLMVAVALGAIALINLTSADQQHGRYPARLFSKGFNAVYFGRFNIDLARSSPISNKAREAIAHNLNALSDLNNLRNPNNLSVDILRTLPTFRLAVRFEADRQPLGILGASGSGKSLTLRCIAGLERPTQGKIVLNGRVLFDSAAGINVKACDRNVGFVFQNYALFPHLTVAQNIAFGMRGDRRSRAEKVVAYLEMMDLVGLGDRYPKQLSGGQQQRVALARALAIEPDILLLDEPLSALDTYLRSQIEKLLIRVLANYSGVTLFVTHKLEEAYRVCPHLLVISNGQLLANNTREQIFHHPPTFAVAQVTECKNFSRVRLLASGQIEALDWNCSLEITLSALNNTAANEATWVGIRAHHIRFISKADSPNTFLGWIAAVSETQHRVTLYIKLRHPPTSAQDYHLQAEVYREKWEQLKGDCTLYVQLDPNYLILMPT